MHAEKTAHVFTTAGYAQGPSGSNCTSPCLTRNIKRSKFSATVQSCRAKQRNTAGTSRIPTCQEGHTPFPRHQDLGCLRVSLFTALEDRSAVVHFISSNLSFSNVLMSNKGSRGGGGGGGLKGLAIFHALHLPL